MSAEHDEKPEQQPIKRAKLRAEKSAKAKLRDAPNARLRPKRKLPQAMVAYQIKPGEVRNPWGGNAPGSKRELYRESRRLALDAAPAAMRRAIELVGSKDERVATINIQTVLDRAGIRPIEAPEVDDDKRPRFDPSRLSLAQLAQLEAALRLYVQAMVMPEDDASAADESGRPIRTETLPPGGDE